MDRLEKFIKMIESLQLNEDMPVPIEVLDEILKTLQMARSVIAHGQPLSNKRRNEVLDQISETIRVVENFV